MGLSVISQLATAISNTPASGPTGTNGALPGDFAALLSGQPLAALMAQGGALPLSLDSITADAGKQDPLMGDTGSDSGVSVLDPAALIAMLGAAQIQPAVRSEQGDASVTHPDLAASSTAQWTAAQTLNEPKTKDLPLSSKGLPAQSAFNPGALSANDPAPASQPAPEAANIAAATASAAPTTGNLTTFNEAISTSLHQRGVTHGPQGTVNMSTASVATHLQNPAWPQQFSEKIVWMASRDVQSAQININPPQLGPVQITLNLSGDQATAVFASPHAEVRQAIESSLPQLKEMLASAGISLGDANVGANLAQQNQNSPFLAPNRTQGPLENAILPANDNAPGAGVATPLQQGRGLVDLFA